MLERKYRRVLRFGRKTLVVCLALYGLCEFLPSATTLLLWKLSGFEDIAASAYFRLEIENATGSNLLVAVENLNDAFFEMPSAFEQRYNQRIGRVQRKEILIRSQEYGRVSLPSNIDPRIGVVLVTARTNIADPGDSRTEQRLALYLVTWATLQSGLKDNGYFHLCIELKDLQVIDESFVPSVSVVKRET